MTALQEFLQLLDGGGGGYIGGLTDGGGGGGVSGGASSGVEIQNDNGTLTAVPVITNNNSATPPSEPSLNYQILPEGFGSYLQGILPDDIATAAGAFSATMQQIKNIRKIDIEKFAQAVTSLETTANLPLTAGTNIPVDAQDAQTALALIALGSGPYNTFTYSDFFGCMSGLTYDWVSLQTAISNMPTGNLSTIYTNLYAATQGPTLGLDAAVQAQIDLANAELAVIRSTYPGQSMELNDLWETTATQLNIEQRARSVGLSPVPSPRTSDLFPYPTMVYSFTDSVPIYAKFTQPNMAAQTLEAISDLNKNTGQSIVAMMRSDRNQTRLLQIGIPLDDNIPDSLSAAEATELIANGTVANSAPAFPFNVAPAGYYDPVTKNFLLTVINPGTTTAAGTTTAGPAAVTNKTQPEILGAPNSSVAAVLGIGTANGLPVPSPDIGIGTKGISQVAIPDGSPFFAGPGAGGGEGSQGGGPIVPGSLAGSPFTKLISPALNPVYTSGTLLPAALTVAQAIEQVITCNCDCWVQ